MAKILIADDSLLARRKIKDLLIAEGHKIIAEAVNGAEAVNLYQEHLPDLVTMDINMPVMDGLRAFKLITDNHPGARVIILTAAGNEEKVIHAKQQGVKYFLVKPFNDDRFMEIVHKALDEEVKANQLSDISEGEKSYQILAIDDSKTSLAYIKSTLAKLNDSVITASSGEMGLELAETGIPDLILLDVVMPEMDGFDVLTRLKKNEFTRDIPVIMFTDNTKKEDVLNAMKFGVADYISKKAEPEIFRKKIESSLRYSALNRADERNGKYILVERRKGKSVVSFRQSIAVPEAIKEASKIFNSAFVRTIEKDIIVLDIRLVNEMQSSDIDTLMSYMDFFPQSRVKIVAGRNYGALVSEVDERSGLEIFISFGDMEVSVADDFFL